MKFIGSLFMCHPFYKTFQFLGNICREVIDLPFPFVFSSWAFGVNFFWIIARTVIEVINMSTGWIGRFLLSTECYRTRKLDYNDLNWPRCSAQVTESLALTDGGFC